MMSVEISPMDLWRIAVRGGKNVKKILIAFVIMFGVFTGLAHAACTSDQIDVVGDGSNCQTVLFSATTTNLVANDSFSFSMSANGTFYVDWGDGSSIQTITRSQASGMTSYSHTYTSGGVQTIRFAGVATGYSNYSDDASIRFQGNTKLAAIDGNLSAMFPMYSNGGGASTNPGNVYRPFFNRTFQSCTSLTRIPPNLFSNYIDPAYALFYYTFYNCSSLSGYIPPTTFAGLIEHGSPTGHVMWSNTFSGTGLVTSCPTGTREVDTGYKSNWGGKVSCVSSTPMEITLDTTGATAGTPTSVYLLYETGWYSDVAGNDTITQLSTLPEKTGKVFGGFYTDKNATGKQIIDRNGNILSGNLKFTVEPTTLYAYFGDGPYTVTYDCGVGAAGNPPATATVIGGMQFTPAANNTCAKTGHTFGGWNDGTTDRPAGTTYTYNYGDDITLTAHFSPSVYAISYTLNGGTNYSGAPTIYTYGTGATIDGTPTKALHTFDGWCTDAELQNCAMTQTIGTDATGDKTFYAKWIKTAGSITYTMNSGTNYSGAPTTYNYGTSVTINGMPTRSGYTFTGWTGSNGNTPQMTVAIGTSDTGDKTYTANWSQCNACNGSGVNCSLSVVNNVCTYTTSCKTGYENLQNNGAYNASCTAQTSTVTLNQNYSSSDNTTIATVTATYDSNMPTKDTSNNNLVALTRTGYTFNGYWDARTGGTQYYTASMSSARTWNKTGAQTLYARWTANTYNITLNGVSQLPSGYTELDYIKSTGSQYLCTDIHPSLTMVSQIGLKMTSYTGKMIYGFLVDTVMSDGRWTYRLFNYSGKIYYDVGNDNTRLIGSNNSFQNNTYYDFEVGNFYVKNLSTNTTLLTGSPVSSFSWNPQNYYMCVFNDGRTTPASGEVHYLKIYDNDALVGNFIPAKRNSDNVLGMYDTVTGVFKTNAGTGTFTAGPVANVSTYTVGVGTTLDTVPTRNGYTFAGWCTDAQLQNCAMTQTISASDTGDKTFYAKWTPNASYTVTYACGTGTTGNPPASETIVANEQFTPAANNTCAKVGHTFDGWNDGTTDRPAGTAYTYNYGDDITLTAKWTPNTYNITLNGVSQLPSGYTELEYIQSTGTQYLCTDIHPSLTMVSQIGLKMSSYTGNMIYGLSAGSYKYRLFNYSGKIYYDVNNDSTRLIGNNNSFQNDTYYDFEVGNFYVKNLATGATVLSGSSVSSFSWDPQNYYMCIFNDGRTTPASGEVYYLKIYDNDELVGNFIPAKRNSDNVLGMYDTVTGVFKTNAGTGIFTAGPDVTDFTGSSRTLNYTYGIGATIDDVPTKEGYTFAGWCTDAQLQNCAMTQTISASDTGDKTFYAKWTQSYTCNAGYYLPMNANACTICPANSYCAGGTYEFSSTVPQGVVSCATGLLSPTGMWEVAQCGRRLHFGDDVVYLRATKKTTHAMHFDMDHDGVADYFANMTTIDTPAHAGTNRRLKVYFGGQVYFVYDDTVNPGQ